MTAPAESRWILIAAAIGGASGVALGAWAAHGLAGFLADLGYEPELVATRLEQFDTGVRYHLLHAVALLALAAMPVDRSPARRLVAGLFVLGIVLFSGSLYGLVLSNQTRLGMVTPLGGLSLILGWLTCLAMVARSTTPSGA